MAESKPIRCLILACGNTLRGDDGVGPWLAEWAEERLRDQPNVRVIARQQWTPDLAKEIAIAESVLFIDCSIASEPGTVRLTSVTPAASNEGLATHHQSACDLLQLARELYDCQPGNAQLLTIGAGSIELGEDFSDVVKEALPRACNLLEEQTRALINPSRRV
jgi:hydrogenase maturation protease